MSTLDEAGSIDRCNFGAGMIASVLLFGLAALFVATGVSKGLRHKQFVSTVASYRLVPRRFAPLAAAVATSGEIAGGVIAVGPEAWGRIGLVVIAVIAGCGALLATVDLLAGDTDHSCGCLGPDPTGRLMWWHPLRSAAVAVAASALAMLADSTAWAIPLPYSLLLLLALALAWTAFLATVELHSGLGSRLRSNDARS